MVNMESLFGKNETNYMSPIEWTFPNDGSIDFDL